MSPRSIGGSGEFSGLHSIISPASKPILSAQRGGSGYGDWHFFTSAALRSDRRFARAVLYSS